ncbi:MAG: GTP 3',8-cyclase MoaA [Acidimicrobiales bacterium]
MAEQLIDGFGRIHRDLRISVTDRCNFRCQYCMPAEGMQWMPRSDLLRFEEIERVARILVERFGIDAIRLTGGEPTIRAHLPVLIEKLAGLGTDLSLTTNGTNLNRIADDLVAAGLKRINVSMDSLRADRFEELTRRDELEHVLAGIDAAIAAGLDPVKINAVMMRGINDDELLDFARFGRDRGVTVRFIEFMPLDATGDWSNDQVVTLDEIVTRIGEEFPLEPVERSAAPARDFRYLDGKGRIGVVASVTEAFCGTCDRIRLTADGQLRNCLFAVDEFDVRSLLRAGSSDDAIAKLMTEAVAAKWEGHQINQVQFIRPKRSMSQIGG